MKCFNYIGGELRDKLITDDGLELKTCSLSFSVPPDWDVEELLDRIKSKEYCDVLLHVDLKIVEGDSVSSVFPKGTALVRCVGGALSIENIDNSALVANTTGNIVDYILLDGSIIYDSEQKLYISNVKNKVTTSTDMPDKIKPEDLKDFVIEL